MKRLALLALIAITPNVSRADPVPCDGVRVVEYGKTMFRGIIPALYMNVENASPARREVLFDIKYHVTGHTVLYNVDEVVWEEYGPAILHPNETGTFMLKDLSAGYQTYEILEIDIAKCG